MANLGFQRKCVQCGFWEGDHNVIDEDHPFNPGPSDIPHYNLMGSSPNYATTDELAKIRKQIEWLEERCFRLFLVCSILMVLVGYLLWRVL